MESVWSPHTLDAGSLSELRELGDRHEHLDQIVVGPRHRSIACCQRRSYRLDLALLGLDDDLHSAGRDIDV